MTTLKDYLQDMVDEAVELGRQCPPDLEDQKVNLLDDWFVTIVSRLIGA